MPVKVVSSGRGVKIAKPTPVVKKTEELKGMGKGKVRNLVLKEDIPKKYVKFSWLQNLNLLYNGRDTTW